MHRKEAGTMRRSQFALGAVAATAGLFIYWRWFPRAGTRWANEELNPWLVEHGWAGRGRSELGTLEHVGRTSGIRRLTPVHPVATADGFRIVVPLAERSQWALNVLAAGHCRLQVHDTVFDLDEPVLVAPADVRDLRAAVRWAETKLGFRYLRLHRFAERPGTLEPVGDESAVQVASPVGSPEAVEPAGVGGAAQIG
jgi:F420H(2)-dependent quinone reductase